MSDNDARNNFGLLKFPDLPASVDHAIENITDKPTKEIGDTFGDIFHLVFGKIQHERKKARSKRRL